jgi:hypothetical protein
MTLSQRMRIKKEKTKFLLGEKKRRESETDEGSICQSQIYSQSYSSSSNKDYIIDEDKFIPLVEKMDILTKKEIKILRNRISAQKSRDRKKQELDELKIVSNNLFAENNLLQNKLSETERELKLLKEKIKNCERCGKGQDENNLTISQERKHNNHNHNSIHHNTIISTNSQRNHTLNTSISDMSNASRSNFSSSRSKLGLFTGLFLVVFLIGCLMLSPINENKLRVLQSLPEPSREIPLNIESNQTAMVEFKGDSKIINNLNPKNLPVKKKDHPVAVRHSDENLLGRKRNEFMINMANKFRVAQSIDKINNVPRNYNFRNDNLNSFKEPNASEYCINNNDVTCQIKDETQKLNKYIVPKNYFENLIGVDMDSSKNEKEISVINNFKGNVESLLCKDYVTTSDNKNHNFEEIIRKKLMEKDIKDFQTSKDSDCMYLHMLIPAKENSPVKNKTKINIDEIDTQNIKPENKINTYFEIGCKIFEINKIYK